jgi:hypothetical protein
MCSEESISHAFRMTANLRKAVVPIIYVSLASVDTEPTYHDRQNIIIYGNFVLFDRLPSLVIDHISLKPRFHFGQVAILP